MNRGARLHITGIVQGVGFRPFIYNLAGRLGLTGWIRNTSAGVDIEVDGPADALEVFVNSIRHESPTLARIEELNLEYVSPAGFDRFEILGSEIIPDAFQAISPDVALCDDCLREMMDPGDRRFRYPFINCTNCGPRFTIVQDIPYDRPRTTMARFEMCPDCAREYGNPADRRFHAQPIACPVCGPHVWLEAGGQSGDSPIYLKDDAIREARRLLAAGQIVAVKGLGGFHLACDATNRDAVLELRSRKLRVDKPFAIMFPDIGAAQAQCIIDAAERALLESAARPIVLLRRRVGTSISREVAPGQDWLGAMLPYTPLHHLLIERAESFPVALVMTSGNLSEEPIATDNVDARRRLSPLADALLIHDRDIHVRADDSVVRVASDAGADSASDPGDPATTLYPLRRSRGYVPFPVRLPWQTPPVLGVGAELKNTFCITNRDYGFMSHHIGDMENYETLQSFEQGIAHFERLFRAAPQAVAFDLHPDYLSTRYAQRRAAADGLAAIGVQHHHAHIAACMAEHRLDGSHAIIGVAFDGTGYGEDGAIWGGEMLVTDYAGYQRRFHLDYFPLPGGDAAIKHPGRTALALLWSLGLAWDERLPSTRALGDEERAVLVRQLEGRLNCPSTSSIGRLFDAAASLAGVRQTVNYEAQAAIEFEALADNDESEAYSFDLRGDVIDPRPIVAALVGDVLAGMSVSRISARFHLGIAHMVTSAALRIRDETGLNEVALSGGVWQNITLLRRTLSLLRSEGFQVYIHREVPANDGGLALGQAVIAAARMRANDVPGHTRTNSPHT